MKKHFVIFIIVFALTVAVPIIVYLITGRQVSNESIAGIFNDVKGTIQFLNCN